MMRQLLHKLKAARDIAESVARGKAVETIEAEAEELTHIFGLVVLGSFVGLPAPPMQVALDLLPLMERELAIMVAQIETANAPLSKLFSVFSID